MNGVQDKALKNTVTIPKRMLPLRLALFKQLLLRNNKLVPATNTASAFTDTPSSESSIFGPDFNRSPGGPRNFPRSSGGSAVLDRPTPSEESVIDITIDKDTSLVQTPVEEPTSVQVPSAPSNDAAEAVADSVQYNIVVGPQIVDSPVTKQNKPEGGVPLAQPIDARTLERRRQQKGLKPGQWFTCLALPVRFISICQGVPAVIIYRSVDYDMACNRSGTQVFWHYVSVFAPDMSDSMSCFTK